MISPDIIKKAIELIPILAEVTKAAKDTVETADNGENTPPKPRRTQPRGERCKA